MSELLDLDATAQAEAIKKGECAPTEITEAAIAQIEKYDPELNAVIHPSFEKGLENIEKADPASPFYGVPILIKDMGMPTKGDPHHMGLKVLKEINYIADSDSFLMRDLRETGLAFLGRTNVPELGTSSTTEPEVYGPTLNPWNTERTAGGSSGGSGAAITARMVSIAHASDGGGSIRIPASINGLVGVKPTRGRISYGPQTGEGWGPLGTDGFLSRTVRDSAAILDLTAKPYAGDPNIPPQPLRPYMQEAGESVKDLRIGFTTTAPSAQGKSIDPECEKAVHKAVNLLEDMGCKIAGSHPEIFDDESPPSFLAITSAGKAASLRMWAEKIDREIPIESLEPLNQGMVKHGQNVSGMDYIDAREECVKYARRLCGWWDEGFDILLTPTLALPPWELGRFAFSADIDKVRASIGWTSKFTMPFNATGQPAMSLPLHWTEDGLPVGVQFVAPYGREDMLFRLAFALEEASPWADRKPPLITE